MQYELCYLVGESKEQNLSKIKEDVKNIVSQEGGSFLEPQIEEKRKMAYKVGKDIRGIYVTQRFEISKEEEVEFSQEVVNPIASINKKLNLNQDVLRFIIIRADEFPELKLKEKETMPKKNFKKTPYFKKSEPVIAKKEKTVVEEKETKKPAGDTVSADKDSDEKKSFDEKIDEILNI